MLIRPIELKDNQQLALAIRAVLIEMGVPKVGTAYEDKELDEMYETYDADRSRYFVIEKAGDILGGAGLAPLKDGAPNVCELQKMYFMPDARGKGKGKEMIHKCLSFARAQKFDLCYIETMPNMLDAQTLYKKVGFEYIQHPMGNTGHSSCPVWMTKSLK
jgi:putative acetyltransferase